MRLYKLSSIFLQIEPCRRIFSSNGRKNILTAFPSVTMKILAASLDLSPDALVVVDVAGTIVLVNEQTETMFGYRQEEMAGQPVEMLLPEGLRALHVAHRARYGRAPRLRPMGRWLIVEGRHKDGHEFPVDVSLRPVMMEETLHVIGAIRDMSVQRIAESEHHELAKRLYLQGKLVNLAHDAILVCDPKNHIVSWNRGAEKLYGWNEQEAVGQITHSLLQASFPQPLETIEEVLAQEGQWEGDLIHTCRDGEQVIVESRQVLVRDARGTPTSILEINRDVTERRRLEQVEREARAEMDARLKALQLILNELPISICLVQGPQARLILANRASTALWGAEWKRGQPMENFLAQHAIRLFTEDGRPLSFADSPIRRAVTSGEATYHYQDVIRQPDGTNLPVLVNTIPLDALRELEPLSHELAGGPAAVDRVALIVHQDVTALKEAETLKDTFINIVTHELRTPVTVLAGYTDMLLRRAARGKGPELDEWQRAKLSDMKQAAHQLAKLTEDLQHVTRVQAGQFQLQLSPTDLVALTRQVVDRLQPTADRHHLSIHTSLAQLWATVDAFRIEQVLTNLLTNAIKYSPQGGPIEVTIKENAEAHEARFSVRDYGMGIPREQQAHIFERFVRADNVRATRISGTGLGLYLCRELVERHGGRIYFESEENAGSTFFFTLPISAP